MLKRLDDEPKTCKSKSYRTWNNPNETLAKFKTGTLSATVFRVPLKAKQVGLIGVLGNWVDGDQLCFRGMIV